VEPGANPEPQTSTFPTFIAHPIRKRDHNHLMSSFRTSSALSGGSVPERRETTQHVI
jgi:hypothetical protein